MDLPPSLTGQEGIIPCVQNNHSSKEIKRIGEGVSSGEPIAFQRDKDITHVEAPS
jgi:hypothetical protein